MEDSVAGRELLVRPATTADLEAVTGIYEHYVLGSVATFEEVPPSVVDWRRRLDDLAGRGLPFLVATVGGDASAALHRSFGFTHAGRLVGVGYKHDRWVDTVLMQRDLTPGGAG